MNSQGACARAAAVALLSSRAYPTPFSYSSKLSRNKMTLKHKLEKEQEENMDGCSTKEANIKSTRPIRNRRYTRLAQKFDNLVCSRSLIAGHRPQKRLFTPDIKRYLKDWLIRRRENPYPNREEKKHLSRETGLTYVQICNWFANWRRKLKNVNENRTQPTWGHLIRTYNDRAQGNVEQFSISSNDSIWSEPRSPNQSYDETEPDHGYSPDQSTESQQDSDAASSIKEKPENINNNCYNIEPNAEAIKEQKNMTSPILLNKWLDSAARFQPSESNYLWWEGPRRKPASVAKNFASAARQRHGQDEVEAAVALTALATGASTHTPLAAP